MIEENAASELRWRADEIARKAGLPSEEETPVLAPDDAKRIIHELRVHQIELSLQNEELQRAQASLDVLRKRYYDLYNLAPVGYLVISLKGLILEVNHAATQMLGHPRGMLIQQPISRFIFRDDQDVYYKHRLLLHKSDQPHSCELRMVREDGTTFWMRLTASAPEPSSEVADAPITSRVVLHDISDFKRVEAERAALEAKRSKSAGRTSRPK